MGVWVGLVGFGCSVSQVVLCVGFGVLFFVYFVFVCVGVDVGD